MSELTPEQFSELVEQERNEARDFESTETLLFKLETAIENDEPPTTYGAQALARVRELRDRLED